MKLRAFLIQCKEKLSSIVLIDCRLPPFPGGTTNFFFEFWSWAPQTVWSSTTVISPQCHEFRLISYSDHWFVTTWINFGLLKSIAMFLCFYESGYIQFSIYDYFSSNNFTINRKQLMQPLFSVGIIFRINNGNHVCLDLNKEDKNKLQVSLNKLVMHLWRSYHSYQERCSRKDLGIEHIKSAI